MVGVFNLVWGGWGEAGSEGCGWPGRCVLLLQSGFLLPVALNMEDHGSG